VNSAELRLVFDLEPFQGLSLGRYGSQGFNPGLCTQFVVGNKASPDGLNEYRLEALCYIALRSVERYSRSCGKTITADPPRRRDGVK
jgi:hypothetical protein